MRAGKGEEGRQGLGGVEMRKEKEGRNSKDKRDKPRVRDRGRAERRGGLRERNKHSLYDKRIV